MKFFIYEVTNLINNKKYRGFHKTNNIEDSYLGSGPAIKNAIKKYGKENFKREILEYCNSFEELLVREEFFVNEEWVKRNDTYNMRIGGKQSIGRLTGLTEESKKKISETLKSKYASGEVKGTKGSKRTNEQKQKMSKIQKEIYNSEKGIKLREKLSILKKGKTAWNKGKKMSSEYCKRNSESHKGIVQSEETKKKRSESMKRFYANKK